MRNPLNSKGYLYFFQTKSLVQYSDVDARDMTEEEVRMLMSEANEERMAASDVLLNNSKILGQKNPKSTSMNISLRQSSGMLAYTLILYSLVYSSLRHTLVL